MRKALPWAFLLAVAVLWLVSWRGGVLLMLLGLVGTFALGVFVVHRLTTPKELCEGSGMRRVLTPREMSEGFMACDVCDRRQRHGVGLIHRFGAPIGSIADHGRRTAKPPETEP
ncbi:MAG: hypothetical protein FJ318_00475 [SAR202 cluster bacterium]|nr:hypothetical protein [SAR202 cluster bacterium]